MRPRAPDAEPILADLTAPQHAPERRDPPGQALEVAHEINERRARTENGALLRNLRSL